MQSSSPTTFYGVTTISPQRQKVIDAARRSINQRGMTKTTMLVLASDMGISRQTLYRTFENRDELLALVYVHEFDKSVSELLEKVLGESAFDEAIAKSVLLAIEVVDENPILNDMMLGSGALWFQSQILDHRTPLYGMLMAFGEQLWEKQLNEARKKHLLNSSINNEEAVEWLLTNHYLTMARPKETRTHSVDILQKLVIPALMKS